VHVTETKGLGSFAQILHMDCIHWRETIPMSAVVRLSTKLRNQKTFTQMLKELIPGLTKFMSADWAAICLKICTLS